MQPSDAVRDGLRTFYERFSAHDAEAFDDLISTSPGVSVIGSAPGEGHTDRGSWIGEYRDFISAMGIKLEGGPGPRAFEEGAIGLATDEPRFVLPDGSFLPARLTAVLRREGERWRIVHMHFSVGVPDEQAIQAPGSDQEAAAS